MTRWSPLVASSLGWTDTQFTPYLHLFASLGPPLAALLMARAEGRASLRRPASPFDACAAAIGAPIALYLVAAGVLVRLGYRVNLSATGTSDLLTIAGLTVPFRFGRANLAPRPRVIEPDDREPASAGG